MTGAAALCSIQAVSCFDSGGCSDGRGTRQTAYLPAYLPPLAQVGTESRSGMASCPSDYLISWTTIVSCSVAFRKVSAGAESGQPRSSNRRIGEGWLAGRVPANRPIGARIWRPHLLMYPLLVRASRRRVRVGTFPDIHSSPGSMAMGRPEARECAKGAPRWDQRIRCTPRRKTGGNRPSRPRFPRVRVRAALCSWGFVRGGGPPKQLEDGRTGGRPGGALWCPGARRVEIAGVGRASEVGRSRSHRQRLMRSITGDGCSALCSGRKCAGPLFSAHRRAWSMTWTTAPGPDRSKGRAGARSGPPQARDSWVQGCHREGWSAHLERIWIGFHGAGMDPKEDNTIRVAAQVTRLPRGAKGAAVGGP